MYKKGKGNTRFCYGIYGKGNAKRQSDKRKNEREAMSTILAIILTIGLIFVLIEIAKDIKAILTERDDGDFID